MAKTINGDEAEKYANSKKSFFAKSRLGKWAQDHQEIFYGTIGVLAFLIIWQAMVWLGLVNPVLTSSPIGVALSAYKLGSAPLLWESAVLTLREFAIGFVAAIVVGIILGILTGWYTVCNGLLNPFVSALYAIPRIAVIPLFILWFGIGIQCRVALVFFGAVLPIIVNTAIGIRVLDPAWLRVARSFGAKDTQIFRTVALPGSVPYMLGGLRIGIGQGLVAVIAAELFVGTEGLGHLLAWYGASFLMSELMVVILMTAVLGIAFVTILSRIEKRFESWRAPLHE